MSRWRPTRAGILNVWRYYDEVLTFEDGRVLLRGPNGSGKSKALELLLPFLFDADLRASRLSTFGSGTRSMHWNLMGQGATGTTRVGYVWLELSREDGDGDDAEFFTIGARLQASRADTKARVAYFVVHGRVGVEVSLTVDDAPLTVAGLREELTCRGTVFERDAAGYRDAVRRTLFATMTPERYETLVHALLQLRRPKLSEHLDPESLSSILSAALPPVDEGRIQELAEGFERLDQQRAHLELLEDEVKGARSLLEATRSYAHVVLRERAKAVTSAATDVDRASRDIRSGAQALDDARARLAAAETELAAARQRLAELDREADVLRRSDDYKQGTNLEELRQKVARAVEVAHRSRSDAEKATQRAQQSRQRAIDSADAAERAQQDQVAAHATAVSLATELDASHLVGSQDLDAYLGARRGQVQELTILLDGHDEAVADRSRYEATLAAARGRLAAAQQELDGARAAVDVAAQEHVESVLAWARSCHELPLPERDVVAALDGDDVTGLVRDVLGTVLRDHERRLDDLARERTAVTSHRAELVAARADLRARRAVAPPVPRFRTVEPDPPLGGRLWQLVDFRNDVPDDVRSGIEAALEASGLLDAWVSTSGQVRADGHDVLVDPAQAVSEGEPLSRVLHPDPGPGAAASGAASRPSEDVVRRVLDAIGFAQDGAEPAASSHSWVAADGRWRLGVARGSWSKPTAQYVGAGARERHRLERIAELDEQIVGADVRLAELERLKAGLATRIDSARAEADAAPSDRQLRQARRSVERIETIVGERDRAESDAARARDDAEAAVADAHQRLVVVADRLRLPPSREALERVAGAITGLRDAAQVLAAAARRSVETAQRAADQREQAQTDESDADALRRRAADDEAGARTERATLQSLQERLGDSYERIVARLDEIEAAHRQVGESLPTLERHGNDARTSAVRLETRIENAQQAHEDALRHREEVQEAFVALLGTTLATDADVVVELPREDAVRAVLEVARRLDRDLPDRGAQTAAAALSRLTQRFHQTAGRLASRAQLELTERDRVTVPVAVGAGRRTGVGELVRAIEDERVRTRTEITAGEHDLFERALTGDTRRHLSETIRDANDLVGRMNDRLASVRTASEVQVRLSWVVRDEQGTSLREARQLLLKNPEQLSEVEHDALHRFFRERIDEASAEGAGRSWAQQLATVFDYTAWHRFRVELSRGDGQGWRTLTRQAHGVLSGGEKAIALHLPLFAALAAHYEATPSAPRLILLDEVFVGIDTVNRGQIFALLRDLDLDLFLTSDHEWATYPEVEGIAIHALAAGADDDEAVTTTRFVWTGHELTEDPLDALFA